ncbi:MAG TPA: GNAT family N-acetyltransferase [Flavisolibacter sp.]|nr:GNAT family N-acetyltransferase [Flavisolibacter sp.]
MLIVKTVTEKEELEQIHRLNQENLKQNLSIEELSGQGFVTWLYSMELLKKMNNLAPSVIVKDNDKVVGYALVTLQECASFHKDLYTMMDHIKKLAFRNAPITSFDFYCMGQICIDKDYRGKGLVKMLYQKHREIYSQRFQLLVTEISTSNKRSMNAHNKIGFVDIHTYRDILDEWNVVVWDWN